MKHRGSGNYSPTTTYVIGGVVGGFCAVIIIGCLIFIIYRYCNISRANNSTNNEVINAGSSNNNNYNSAAAAAAASPYQGVNVDSSNNMPTGYAVASQNPYAPPPPPPVVGYSSPPNALPPPPPLYQQQQQQEVYGQPAAYYSNPANVENLANTIQPLGTAPGGYRGVDATASNDSTSRGGVKK